MNRHDIVELLLQARLCSDLSRLIELHVHQSFLPKFKNEWEEEFIAEKIAAQADKRFMQITTKHSGSLITLSADAIGAKNSVGNSYTNGARLLLYEHFRRCWG